MLQDKIFQNDNMYRQIFKQSHNPVFILSSEYIFLDANNAAGSFFEKDIEKLIGKSFTQFFNIQKDEIEGFKNALITGDCSFKINEKVKYLKVSVLPSKYCDERVILIIGTDITSDKKLEQMVKEKDDKVRVSEVSYKSLFDSMKNGVVVYKAVDNGLDFVFLSVNKAAEKIDKIKAIDIIGHKLTKVFPAVKGMGFLDCLIRVWKSGKSEHYPEFNYQDYRIQGWRDNYVYKLPTGEVVAVYEDLTEKKQCELDMFKEKEKLAVTIASIGDALIATDMEGNITIMNPVAEKLTGYKKEEAIGKSIDNIVNIINEVHLKPIENPIYRVIKEGTIKDLANHTALIHKNGTIRSIEDRAAPIIDAQKTVQGAIMVFHDVSEKRIQEERLRKSEEMFRLLAENARDVIYKVRIFPEREFEYISPSVTVLTGYMPEEFYLDSKLVYKIVYPDDQILLKKMVDGGIESSWRPLIIRWVSKDNRVIWVEQKNVLLYDDNGNLAGLEGIARDITEKFENDMKLTYLRLYDSLTGLYNRKSFDNYLEQGIFENQYPLGIIICDIDGLKKMNDSRGHAVGDNLIISAARIIERCFEDDSFIARIGGDEFAIILSHALPKLLEKKKKQIENEVRRFNKGKNENILNLSIGYAISSMSADLKNVLKEADDNVFRVKIYKDGSRQGTIIRTLMKTLQESDYSTQLHADRIHEMAGFIGSEVGMGEGDITNLRLLAQFHDIGKVGIPSCIIKKEGPLTSQEREEIQRHSEIGYRIAQTSPELLPVADYILKHHEWWNGQGYPLGIKGKDIPFACRILAILDAYEAMTSDRPYRKAISHEEAIKEIYNCAGTQFDPSMVDKVIEALNKYDNYMEMV